LRSTNAKEEGRTSFSSSELSGLFTFKASMWLLLRREGAIPWKNERTLQQRTITRPTFQPWFQAMKGQPRCWSQVSRRSQETSTKRKNRL